MIECIITSSVLILVLIALRFLFRGKISRRLQYTLWGLVLLRLLMPLPLLSSQFSIMNVMNTGQFTKSVSETQADSNIIMNAEMTLNEAKVAGNGTFHETRRYPVESNSGILRSYIFNNPMVAVLGRILKTIWFIGSIATGLWVLSTNLTFYRKLKSTRQPYNVINCKLPVYVTEQIASPCLFGILHPVVYLTPKAIEKMDDIHYVLTHELCHYYHGDHIWSIFRELCLTLYWWNPLVWAAAILSRADGELACDEAVIKSIGVNNRLAYGYTLVDMIEVRKPSSGIMCTATTMTTGKHDIKERLNMIINNPKTIIPALLVVLMLVTVCIGCTFTGAHDKTDSSGNISAYAQALYDSRNSYIGDASANAKLVGALGISEELGEYVLELETEKEPYILSIVFNNEATNSDALEDTMNKNAILLLALIENASEVQWQYNYKDQNIDGIISRTGSLSIDDANALADGDIKSFGQSANKVQSLLDLVESKNDTVDVSTTDQASEGAELDACIADAILSENEGKYLKGDFAAEGHTVLKTVYDNNRTVVYASVLYMEFKYADGAFSEISGGHTAAALTFTKNAADGYALSEYWIPQEGALYDSSLKEKLPADVYKQVLTSQENILSETQACYVKAIEYGQVNTAAQINKLLDTICASPATSSIPVDYINAHSTEYNELLYYGDYTLRYAYSEFLEGGQTDLRGHILLAVMRELLGGENMDFTSDTAQDWFDKWKEKVFQLQDQNSMELMEKNYPKTAMMLKMLRDTA